MKLDGKVYNILRREEPGNFIVYTDSIETEALRLSALVQSHNMKVNTIDTRNSKKDILNTLDRIRHRQEETLKGLNGLGIKSVKNYNRRFANEIKPEVLIIEDYTNMYNKIGDKSIAHVDSRLEGNLCSQLDAVRKIGWCTALTVILVCKDKCEHECFFYLLKEGKAYDINTRQEL